MPGMANGETTDQEMVDLFEGDEDGRAEILGLASAVRKMGSILPSDIASAGKDALPSARSTLERVFAGVLAVVGTVLGWVRVLVILGLVLAVVDAGLFLWPRRDESAFLVGAVIILAFALLPAFVLNLLGKRFAAFRDGVVTIGRRLPELTTLPRDIVDGFGDLAPSLEQTAGKRLPGRLVGTVRAFVRLSKLVRSIVDHHKELFSASSTVIQYGPRDVFYAVYGLFGLVGLTLAMPVLALWALLA